MSRPVIQNGVARESSNAVTANASAKSPSVMEFVTVMMD